MYSYYINVCVCIYIYIERERERELKTENRKYVDRTQEYQHKNEYAFIFNVLTTGFWLMSSSEILLYQNMCVK